MADEEAALAAHYGNAKPSPNTLTDVGKKTK